jgi:RNA recognition motif-containing protein
MSEERQQNKNSQIFIARLHPKVTEKDLKYKFSKFGEIRDIRLKPGYAFIVR